MSERFALGRYERRKCMSKDITLLEEISEQDLHQVNGGTNLTGPGNYLASRAMGDKGPICTISKECMDGCK